MKAVIFDFDGLILDTESAEWEAWQEVYAEHGCQLPLTEWMRRVGTSADRFDPLEYLEGLLSRTVLRTELQARRRRRLAELLQNRPPFPGVIERLCEARNLGLGVGLASASPSRWVEGHLERLGLSEYFHFVCCADHVERAKPDPAVYRLVLTRMGVAPEAAIAFEDSPAGVTAAKLAGLFCVAVPNGMTRQLSLTHADHQVGSLEEITIQQVIEIAAKKAGDRRCS